MNKRPGTVVVTTEVGFCSFCGRPRNLRNEEHQLGTLVRTIVTCETCHRTLSSTMGVADAQPAATEPAAAQPEPTPEPSAAAPAEASRTPKPTPKAPTKPTGPRKPAAKTAKSTTLKSRTHKKNPK